MTSPQFLEFMLSLSVQAAVLVTITHWLCRAANTEHTKCQLWAGCHTLLLLLVGGGLFAPHLRLFHPWSAMEGDSAVLLLELQHRIGNAALWIWCVGFIAAFLIFVWRTVQISRFIGRCRKIDLAEIAADLNVDSLVVEHSGHRQSVTLLANDDLAGPFCWQFHRPYIVMPDYLLTLEPLQLKLIIQHELAHLQAGHPVQLFVQRIVEMIFWYHPMVWWSSHQSALVREFACDATVVGTPGGVADYLHTLLAVVQAGVGRPEAPSASMSFGRGKTIIAKRAERLVAIARDVNASSVRRRLSPVAAYASLTIVAMLVSFVHMPIDISTARKSGWSPWPTWSARILHDFGFQARDFETYDGGYQEMHERFFEQQENQRIR